jgi:hypothetical protein
MIYRGPTNIPFGSVELPVGIYGKAGGTLRARLAVGVNENGIKKREGWY